LVLEADAVLGGHRHLAMLPDQPEQRREAWPSPLREGLPDLLSSLGDGAVVALASGDPFVSGLGTTLVDLLGTDAVRAEPAVSSVSLARARVNWPAHRGTAVSLGGRHPRTVRRHAGPQSG